MHRFAGEIFCKGTAGYSDCVRFSPLYDTILYKEKTYD
jgi:hypothetical protein